MVRVLDVAGQRFDAPLDIGVAALADLDEERVEIALVGARDQGVDLLRALEPLVEAVDPEGAVLRSSLGKDRRLVWDRGGGGLGAPGRARGSGRGGRRR